MIQPELPASIDAERFCASDFAGRIALANAAFGGRLWSPQLARLWFRAIAAFRPDPGRAACVRRLIREFIALAPYSAAAETAYARLLESGRLPAAHPAPGAVHLIISCEKNRAKAARLQAALSESLSPLLVVVGQSGREEAAIVGNDLIVPAPDSYEGLAKKVMEAFLAVRTMFGRVPVLKVDDDARVVGAPDPARIARFLATAEYAGTPVGAANFDRCWHVGKCEPALGVPDRTRFHAPWASGPVYFLGRKALDCVVKEYVFYPGEIGNFGPGRFMGFEDKIVGDILHRNGVALAAEDLAQIFGLRIGDHDAPRDVGIEGPPDLTVTPLPN